MYKSLPDLSIVLAETCHGTFSRNSEFLKSEKITTINVEIDLIILIVRIFRVGTVMHCINLVTCFTSFTLTQKDIDGKIKHT